MGCSIWMAGSVCGIGWNFYIVSFRKMGFGHQDSIYFLGVEKYLDFFYALSQPVCIPCCYIVCVNYFTSSSSTELRRFMSVFICSEKQPLLANGSEKAFVFRQRLRNKQRKTSVAKQRIVNKQQLNTNNWTATEERCFLCIPCQDVITGTVWSKEFSAQLKVRLWREN
jgi:hypothetical protein